MLIKANRRPVGHSSQLRKHVTIHRLLKKLSLRIILIIGLLTTMYSCCPFVKEEYLGSNLYLSEYDDTDRAILYSEKSCSGGGIEIVPMTILEYDYNSEWIIAKSGDKRKDSNIQYWIIKNHFDSELTSELIKANRVGPLTEELFLREMATRQVQLKFREIE